MMTLDQLAAESRILEMIDSVVDEKLLVMQKEIIALRVQVKSLNNAMDMISRGEQPCE